MVSHDERGRNRSGASQKKRPWWQTTQPRNWGVVDKVPTKRVQPVRYRTERAIAPRCSLNLEALVASCNNDVTDRVFIIYVLHRALVRELKNGV